MVELTIDLAKSVPPVLAVGALLNNTVCATKGEQAFISPLLGDLHRQEDFARFERTIERMCLHLEVAPRLVAHDLHPDLPSTRFALACGIQPLAVQHHHAHIAAVAAENGHLGPLIGVALDGFGLGPAEEAWGGELLFVEGPDFVRLGNLALLPQPGGDAAIREPWRMAGAVLWRIGRGGEIPLRFADQKAAGFLTSTLERGGFLETSSCGRLFDAACGLLGIHPTVKREGDGPKALERLVSRPKVMQGGWRITGGTLDLLPLLGGIADCSPQEGADLFHGTLIAAVADWVTQAAAENGLTGIALAGGCFTNRVLTSGLVAALTENGLTPILPRRLSPGDSALSLGQAWIAGLTALRYEHA